MINYIGCLIAGIVALQLSKIESIGIKETKIISIIGWVIALYIAKGKI